MTDAELVRQAQRGHRPACDELVRRWSARVLAFCHARVGNQHLAEDLAQETLLRGLRGLNTLESPGKFGAWLRGIATRVCLDWRKARQSSQVPFSTWAPDQQPAELATTEAEVTEGEVDRADELRRLMNEVESLSEQHREVLMLYYYEDVTYHDVAELLGVSTATINARLTQARAILRHRMSNSPR